MNVQEVDPQGYDQFRKFTTNMLLLSLKEPTPLVNEEGEETCQNVHHQGQTPEEILEVGINSIDELLMRPHCEDSSCDNPVLDVFLELRPKTLFYPDLGPKFVSGECLFWSEFGLFGRVSRAYEHRMPKRGVSPHPTERRASLERNEPIKPTPDRFLSYPKVEPPTP